MSDPVSDPRILRAIAHPTRSRILSELTAGGPARAADLAQQLEIPANQASFHLRQLAKYGLVEEAPEVARDRRDRVWRAADDKMVRVHVEAVRESPGGDAAVAVFTRRLEAWGHQLVTEAMADHDKTDNGSRQRTVVDTAIRLSPEERDEFLEELDKLLEGWTKRTSNRSIERTTYSMFAVFQPYPPTGSGHDDAPATT